MKLFAADDAKESSCLLSWLLPNGLLLHQRFSYGLLLTIYVWQCSELPGDLRDAAGHRQWPHRLKREWQHQFGLSGFPTPEGCP